MLSLLFSFLAVSALADPSALEESMIAQSTFRFSRPTQVRIPVQTCGSKGKVSALQVKVKEGSLRANTFDAFYAVGGRQRLGSNIRLEKGQASAWLALSNQENPCLIRLEMNVGASNAKTTVEVFGRWQ